LILIYVSPEYEVPTRSFVKAFSSFGRSLFVGILYAFSTACILIGFGYLYPLLPGFRDILHLGILVFTVIVLPIVSCYFASRTDNEPKFFLGLLGVTPAAIAFILQTYTQNCMIQTRRINYHGLGAPLGYVDPSDLFATASSFVPTIIWILITNSVGFLVARLNVKQNG